jgi:NadR type nicotinamide-nucleotide adenylyltransferase
MSYLERPRRGLVLGRFLPPHTGHAYVCDFARAYAEDVTVVVSIRPDDAIAGEQRLAWMGQICPGARVIACQNSLPLLASDLAPSAWLAWREAVRAAHPEPIDVVFASEPWGHRLASVIGARFAPVDIDHATVPADADAVLRDPYANWNFLPPPVRQHFLRRVTLFGAESTGKTTLARQLASRFETVVAFEYGRFYTEAFGQDAAGAEDIRRIVLGHLAGVAAARPLANRVLIEDTDPVLTAIWSDVLTGERDPWFSAYRDYPDLYLFCDIDVPWAADSVRYFSNPDERRRFHEACERELTTRGAPVIRLSGSKEQRLATAIAAIEALLAPGG